MSIRAVQPGQGKGRHLAMLAQTRHKLYPEQRPECFRLCAVRIEANSEALLRGIDRGCGWQAMNSRHAPPFCCWDN